MEVIRVGGVTSVTSRGSEVVTAGDQSEGVGAATLGFRLRGTAEAAVAT